MTNTSDLADRRLTFGRDNSFQVELRRRVDEYFRRTGRRQRDCALMYLKTAIILAVFAGVVFPFAGLCGRNLGWQALPLAILLGLSMATIGFNIEHDGAHQAFIRTMPGSTD